MSLRLLFGAQRVDRQRGAGSTHRVKESLYLPYLERLAGSSTVSISVFFQPPLSSLAGRPSALSAYLLAKSAR